MSSVNHSNFANRAVTAPLRLQTDTSSVPPETTAQPPEEMQVSPKDIFSFGSLNSTQQANGGAHFVEYQVKRGDTLSKIAEKQMGAPEKYMDIFAANKDQMDNPNDLRIGMTLKIPSPPNRVDFFIEEPVKTELPPEPPQPEFKEVTVQSGQSLSTLALRHLGNSERYMEILEANKDILTRPESVRAGMKLKIPVSTERASDERGEAISVGDVNAVDARGMTPRAGELYQALKNYQTHHNNLGHTNRTQTSDAELREIAIEADQAGDAFDVDPKIMLAVYAHESGGFNPKARSNTGAGGLGQLTGIAIRQVHYMAGMAKGQRGRAPYTQYQNNFVQSQTQISQRYNIKQNIWTSTAYMAYEIKDRNNGNVKRALERYGDPNVSTYENKVNTEYQTLFGGKLF